MNLNRLRPMVLAVALSLGAISAAAAAPYTELDSQASSIAFGYSQMNVKMDGAFSEIKATDLTFDPAKPEEASVTIEVGLASIDAGYAEANDELKKDEWLQMAEHPVATFQSKKVEPLGDGRYQVTGDLAIKGNTKEVSAPFTFTEQEGAGIFEGAFTFQRADFGIGEGQWKDFGIVANDVEIRFRIVARP